MSINLNVAIVSGRLVRDPELKALPSGTSICNFSLATNHVYTKDGEKKESVEYHNVVLFGKQADNTARFLKKGSEALVEGRLQTRSWEKDGVKHYRTEIIGDSIQFGSKQSSQNNDEDVEDEDEEETPPKKKAAKTKLKKDEAPEYPEEEVDPNDIPY